MGKQSFIIGLVVLGLIAFVLGVEILTDIVSGIYTVVLIALGITSLLVPLFYWAFTVPMKRTYKIRKGWKRSYFKPSFHLKERDLTYTFIIHAHLEKDPNKGTQKIFGFSYGHHHKNSIRLGYRVIDKNVAVVYPYYYIDGVRYDETQFAEIVEVNKKYKVTHRLIGDVMHTYIYDDNDKPLTHRKSVKGFKAKPGYYLYPYYETDDNKGAIQEMRITIHVLSA